MSMHCLYVLPWYLNGKMHFLPAGTLPPSVVTHVRPGVAGGGFCVGGCVGLADLHFFLACDMLLPMETFATSPLMEQTYSVYGRPSGLKALPLSNSAHNSLPLFA